MSFAFMSERAAAWLALRRQRSMPPHMSGPVAVVVRLGYILVSCLSVMILTGWPGSNQQLDVGVASNPVIRLVTLASLAFIAVAATLAAVRSVDWKRWVLSTVVILAGLLAFGVAAGQGRHRAVMGASLALATAAQCIRLGSHGREVLRCVFAAVPFLVAAGMMPVAGAFRETLAAGQERQLMDSAAIGLSLLVIITVASSVEEWRERADSWMMWHVTAGRALVIILFKLALLVALYLGLTASLLGGRPFWRLRLDQPLSWLHALFVGGVIVSVAVRSRARPITPGGFTPRLFVVVAVLATMQIVALVAISAMWLALAMASPSGWSGLSRMAAWVIDHNAPIQFWALAFVSVLTFCEWRIWGRFTSGLYLWLVAGLWLLPPLAGILFAADSTLTYWAAPGQVDTVITLLALGLWLLPTVKRRVDAPRTLTGLVLIPVVVLHFGNLWPSDWTVWLPGLLAVFPTALVLFIDPPRVSADIRRAERSRLLAVAGQTGVILAYWCLTNDANLVRGLETSAVLAGLWLGVPVVAVLAAKVAKSGAPRDITS